MQVSSPVWGGGGGAAAAVLSLCGTLNSASL